MGPARDSRPSRPGLLAGSRTAVLAGLVATVVAVLAPSATSSATSSGGSAAAPPPFLPPATRAPEPPGAGTPDRAANPRVVEGPDGWLFIAQDWTVPCEDAGQAARVGRNARALAAALRARGQDVVVTVGPDKSTVVAAPVPADPPQAACAAASRAAAWQALVTGPDFLDLRPALAEADRSVQTYWRKDTHWTPSGAAVYTRALAERLDPALGRRLRSAPATWSRGGDLARVLERDDAETVPGLRLVNPGVRAEELAPVDIGMGQPARRTRAVAGKGGRVLPGLTVFVGDSFDDVAVEQLAPLFEETLFFWPGLQDSSLPTFLPQVARGDRVVVETVERFTQRFRMFDDEAVQAVRALPPR